MSSSRSDLLPPDLASLLHEALESVRSHPHHHLEEALRERIYSALGPKRDHSRPAPGGAGHYRRTQLALLSVRYVLPLWDQTFPDGTGPDPAWPHEMLEWAELALTGSEEQIESAKTYWRAQRRGVLDCYGEPSYQGHMECCYVAEAAVDALRLAIYEETYDDPLWPAMPDAQKKSDAWDTAYWVAVALTGDTPDRAVDAGSNAKRGAFWEWWLTEAVPQAWASVPDDTLC